MRKCSNCNAYIYYSHLTFIDRYLCECPECKKENHIDEFTEIKFKVLTIWQPWATLLVHGVKKIETRPKPTTWTCEKGIYLIHAASKWSKEQYNICTLEPFKSELLKLRNLYFYPPTRDERGFYTVNFPMGQIIGSIEVTGCKRIYNEFSLLKPHYFTDYNKTEHSYNAEYIQRKEESFGDYTNGRYAWLTQNPRILETPIPYKGGQGYYQNFKGDTNQLKFI